MPLKISMSFFFNSFWTPSQVVPVLQNLLEVFFFSFDRSGCATGTYSKSLLFCFRPSAVQLVERRTVDVLTGILRSLVQIRLELFGFLFFMLVTVLHKLKKKPCVSPQFFHI